MLTSCVYVLIFICGGLFIVAATLPATRAIHWLRSSQYPGGEEKLSREPGESPGSRTPGTIGIHYYLMAVVFAVIEIEALFLVLWAVSYGSTGEFIAFSSMEMLIFTAIPSVALFHAVRKGILSWH